ncbi:ribonuclease III [Candidatus Poriferisocius sp.]|uniref:ribonuclease III n=1 Tax=Candidatus Poriferisocius sp. TaxID=3101276 RepID=UPI003B59A24B
MLDNALTHRSWCAEHPGSSSNERLEFLGDAVVALVVTNCIYEAFPDMAEGELAPLRAEVVRAEALAGLAQELQLGAALRLGRGEEHAGGREKQSILSDAMEAVIGAIYLDAPWEVVVEVVEGWLADRIDAAAQSPGVRDYKTRLQEYCARHGRGAPDYRLFDEGPDHAKHFLAVVHLDGQERGRGEGRSKKQAEQAAAAAAWETLDPVGCGDADRAAPVPAEAAP